MQKTLLALLVANGLAFSSHAQSTDSPQEILNQTENGDQSASLETITVSDTPFSQQVGTQKITEQQIATRPTGNGNITELLKSNPNVRFSNDADRSDSGGEIAPNEVSIHGEKFYNNNYTIDGISNNDNLNPSSNNSVINGDDVAGYSPTDLPGGGTQSFWIDSSLLKNVEVFDSNISAKYGQFTGGVINADIKDPDLTKAHGKVFYRISRDEWAKFHVDEMETFEKAESLGDQPQFTKQQYGININQPINDKAALLFSYSRTESKIPYHHASLDLWENQRRTNETLLLKGIYLPDNGDLWRATLIYSPHQSKYTKKNIKDGYFTNTGGGFRFNLEWEKQFDWLKMNTKLAYRHTGNKIRHSSNVYNYYVPTDSIDWCSSYNSRTGACISALEGGYGKFKTEKQTYTFKQDYEVQRFDTWDIEHKIRFGWQIDLASAKYQRETDVYNYTYRASSSATGCELCIENEQYARTLNYYPARTVKAQDNVYSLYLEDSLTWKNLNIVAGLRFDRSQFLGNNDIAPRLSASYDVFGNQKTYLFGGINRYYSASILAYKLRNGINYRELYTRSSPTSAWTQSTTTMRNYDIAGLKTPYSDEVVLGLSQNIWDTLWTFKWVQRRGKDQFTSSYDSTNRAYYMTNEGQSRNDSFTLTAAPTQPHQLGFAQLHWSLGAQITKTKTNYSLYDATAVSDGYEKMILNGRLLDIMAGLPATDYNSPWSTFLDLDLYFPDLRLNWGQRLSYNAGYRHFTSTSAVCPDYGDACGDYDGKVLIYQEKKQGSYFLWDWRFTYTQPTFKDQYLEFTVDINNVLNRKIVASASDNAGTVYSYKMGRNFWLGVSYNW